MNNRINNKKQKLNKRGRVGTITYVEKTNQPKPTLVIQQTKQQPQKRKGPTPAGQFLRKVGGIAGAFLGSEKIGTQLGAGISRIFGQGDYQVSSNTLMTGPPSFSALNSGIRFSHREYLTDILSSTAYAVNTYRIQPSVTKTFPWLSQMANSFEQYKVNGMVFYLNTTSGNAVSSTNNALGVWGITTVYDPSRPALASKVQAEEYKGCTSGVPSNSLLHAVECKPRSDVLDRYYVDYNQSITGEDLKFYDHGLVNVFTQGQQQAGVALGELWVSYDITFYNPRIQPLGEDNIADHFRIVGNTISATNPCGTAGTVFPQAGSGLSSTITTGGSGYGVLNIPSGSAPGFYMVLYAYNGGNSTASILFDIPAAQFSSNLVSVNSTYFPVNTNSVYFAGNSASPTNQVFAAHMVNKLDNAASTLRLGGTVFMPAASASTVVDIYLIPVGRSITSILKDESIDQKLERMFNLMLRDKFPQLVQQGLEPIAEAEEDIPLQDELHPAPVHRESVEFME